MKDRYLTVACCFKNIRFDILCHISNYRTIIWHHREDQFTESANVSIFTGTWNVNAKKLDGELNDWLLNEQGGKSYSLTYCFGILLRFVMLNSPSVMHE